MVTLPVSGKHATWLEVSSISNPVGKPNDRTIHLIVRDTDRWPSDEKYRTEVNRKLTKRNTFRYDGLTFDATKVVNA